MTVSARAFLTVLLSQDGDRYQFGVEVQPSDINPVAFDCSELIEWAGGRLKVSPRIPDGSWYQARHCLPISIPAAIGKPGALLFRFSSSPFVGGRPRSAHVAVSQGNGRTIEARSTLYGVGQFSAYGRGWTHAGLIPGIVYETEKPKVPDHSDGTAHWTQPSDGAAAIKCLTCVANVHEYHGQTVLTKADVAWDENDPQHLDERYKIVTARLLSELMTLS